jgi:hypothetical protein
MAGQADAASRENRAFSTLTPFLFGCRDDSGVVLPVHIDRGAVKNLAGVASEVL